MDGPTPSDPRHEPSNGSNPILRVSLPWPAWTKKALRASLDEGIFENSHLTVPPGFGSTEHTVHFAGAVDEGVGSPFSRCEFPNYCASELIDDDLPVCHSELASRHDAMASISTLVTDIHIPSRASHTD